MNVISRMHLEALATDVLTAVGVPQDDARLAADCLVYANRSGVDSHGVVRLAHYVRRLSNGTIKARPQIKMVQVRSGILRVHGDDGLGHVITTRAVDRGLEIAAEHGSVAISISDSSHFGMAGFYLRDITNAGMVGMVTTHTDALIVPPGATVPFSGTNPIAFGFPSGGDPVVLDFATSSVAYGKIALAQAEGQSIPDHWGLGANGEPTTDPNDFAGMHPIAGHKGAGLAMIIDLFSAMFSGMPAATHVNRMYIDLDAPRKLGHFISIWDIGALHPIAEVQDRIADYREELHNLPRRPGVSRLFAPGEPEAVRREERDRDGIPIAPGLAAELRELARSLGVDARGL